jgi:hypothetical protein
MERAKAGKTGADEQKLRRNDPLTEKLKSIYDEVASEPLPDDLLKLLDQFDEVARTP